MISLGRDFPFSKTSLRDAAVQSERDFLRQAQKSKNVKTCFNIFLLYNHIERSDDMAFDITKINSAGSDGVKSLLLLNDTTSEYGITLTASEASAIVENRDKALVNTGRIEFGTSVTEKIIKVFCSSPYVNRANFADTVSELTEIFFYYKSEMLEKLSDDELIKLMKDEFDGRCEGSTELLASKALYNYVQKLKGFDVDETSDTEDTDIYG